MLSVFIAASELQFYISDARGKIIQNVKFSSVNQTSDLISKLDPTHQHEYMGMLGFQNKAPNIKLLKIHANQENWAYLEKHDIQRKLIFQIWDHYWIHHIETSPGVVLVLDF